MKKGPVLRRAVLLFLPFCAFLELFLAVFQSVSSALVCRCFVFVDSCLPSGGLCLIWYQLLIVGSSKWSACHALALMWPKRMKGQGKSEKRWEWMKGNGRREGCEL